MASHWDDRWWWDHLDLAIKKRILDLEAAYREAIGPDRNVDIWELYESQPMWLLKALVRHQRLVSANRARGDRNRKERLQAAFVEQVHWRDIYERDCGLCGVCGGRVPHPDHELTTSHQHPSLDHIVPPPIGKHCRANVQLAHHRCNAIKNAYRAGPPLPGTWGYEIHRVVWALSALLASKSGEGRTSTKHGRKAARDSDHWA